MTQDRPIFSFNQQEDAKLHPFHKVSYWIHFIKWVEFVVFLLVDAENRTAFRPFWWNLRTTALREQLITYLFKMG